MLPQIASSNTVEWHLLVEFKTDKGNEILCEHVVIAAGSYSSQVGSRFGLNIPIFSLPHHYFVTDSIRKFSTGIQDLPIVRDERCGGYIRQEQNCGLIGTSENKSATIVWQDGVPWKVENELFEPDYEAISHLLEKSLYRMPVFLNVGIRKAICGAVTYTPDGEMLLGKAKEVDNLWIASGASSGIAWGGGAGKCLADLMTKGVSPVPIQSLNPSRFGCYKKEHMIEQTKNYFLCRGKPWFSLAKLRSKNRLCPNLISQ